MGPTRAEQLAGLGIYTLYDLLSYFPRDYEDRNRLVAIADLTEQQIREYQTGSWVFISAGGRLVDAMEDFKVTFNTLVTLAG